LSNTIEVPASPEPARESSGSSAALVSCHECGELYHARALPPGTGARCGRCGASLYRSKSNSVRRSLNFALTALILIVLANAFPFMTLKVEGREEVNTLFSGVRTLYESGLWPLAALVFATSILFPLLKILGTLYVLAPLRFGYRLPGAVTVFRTIETIHPWAMMEVYLLGVFVAYVNLIDLGQIELGVAVYSFTALIVVMVMGDSALDPREVWEQFGASARTRILPSRVDARFVACHSCGQVSRIERMPRGAHAHCPRCLAAVHRRKPNSLARTCALVLAAAIFYIPANIFPVMTVISFGKGAPDTILSGVKHLIAGGLWPLAVLVFFASIAVPMLKLFGLSFLLVMVKRRSTWRLRDRTLFYRIIEGVGRWSMIDIFMISILVGLVKLGQVATIEPGIGATSFAAVVILTMIAAMTFDPRLMWDVLETESDSDERSRP
jgi:paraquat-inducible protein A